MGLYVSKGGDATKERQFDDDYTLCQRIGKGAFAEVFLCVHKESKERRAAKIVDVEKLEKKDKEHLEDEISILKRLDHPGIIRLYDVFRSPTSVYIVQELCSGGELFDRIVLRHQYTEHCARELVRRVLQAVSYAHSQGVVHRDLKPENILLSDKDNDTLVKLADFGLAHALGGVDGMSTICGTPSYMSPEVVSRLPYSEKTDCWSIGVITYVLLGGFCPFEDQSLPVMLGRIKKAQYKFWNPFFRLVSEDAKDFIRHLLVVDPAKRLTARAALEHKWFRLSRRTLSMHCLVDTQEKLKDMRTARTKLKAAVDTVISLNRMRMLTGGARLSDSLSSAASASSSNVSSSTLDSSNHSATPLSPDVSRHDPSPSEQATEFLAHQRDGAGPEIPACPTPSPETSETSQGPSDVYLPLSPTSSAAPSRESSLSQRPAYPSPDVSTHGPPTSSVPSQPAPGSYGHWDLPEEGESSAATGSGTSESKGGQAAEVERASSVDKFHTPSPSVDEEAPPVRFNRLLLTQCSLRKVADGGSSKAGSTIGELGCASNVQVFLTPSPSIDQEHRASIGRPLQAFSEKRPLSSPSGSSDQTLLLSISSDRLALASPSSGSSSSSFSFSSKPSDPALASGSPSSRPACGDCDAKMIVDGLNMMRLLDKGCSKHRLGGGPQTRTKAVGGSQEAP